LISSLLCLAAACGREDRGSAIRAANAAQSGSPVIVIDKPVHDFGAVPEGGAARHLFKVRNTGKAPLEIKSVTASCGCTAAAPKEKQIAPGGSGEIEVSFDTRGRPGKTEKTVTVASNDPRTPTTILTIKVHVEQLLGFEPTFTFLTGFAGEGVKGETWLSGKLAGDARPRITRVEPQGPTKVQLIERKTDAGPQRGLRFQLAPRTIGQGTFKVVVATGIGERPEVEHQVTWSIRGNVEAPTVVYLDLAQPDLKERVIHVTSRRPDFRLKAARVLDGPFTAQLLPGGEGPRRAVKLTTTQPQPPPSQIAGKLVLESNDPLEPRKEIALTLAAVRSR
jgi:hypothetical protein